MGVKVLWFLVLLLSVGLVGTATTLSAQYDIETTSMENEAADQALLLRYATDTWQAFDALLYGTAIPGDNVDTDGVKAK